MRHRKRNWRRGRRVDLAQPTAVEVEERPALGICAECYEERLVKRCEKCQLNHCDECRGKHECC